MTPKELRIGSKIYFIMPSAESSEFDEKKVITVNAHDLSYINDNESLFEPIPLTEEILLKCKGTLDGYIYNGWDDMQFFRFDEYNASMFELEIINNKFFYGDNRIEFLHDLQNCYYFHENNKKELTVNL